MSPMGRRAAMMMNNRNCCGHFAAVGYISRSQHIVILMEMGVGVHTRQISLMGHKSAIPTNNKSRYGHLAAIAHAIKYSTCGEFDKEEPKLGSIKNK